jgi:hypothetical protein
MARLITIELPQDSVDADALADLQQAGSDGHLSAFWRGFVQQIARNLDIGEDLLTQAIRDRIAQDDTDLPEFGIRWIPRPTWCILSCRKKH